MTEAEWREQLKPGDEVVIERGYGVADYGLARIDRRTKSMVMVGNSRYWINTGWAVGSSDSYRTDRIRQPSPEIRQAIEKKRIEEKVRNHFNSGRWQNLTDDDMRAIHGIIVSREEMR